MEGAKRKLPLNLSFLTHGDFTKQTSSRKSSRNFEDPDGVAGLGILVALNDHHRDHDPGFFSGSRNAVLAISPKGGSNPIPILGRNVFSKKNIFGVGDMEAREEYTRVTSNVSGNLIEKIGAEFIENGTGSNLVSFNDGGGWGAISRGGNVRPFVVSDFLNSCFLCKKTLHGLDIFMYRGDKAFCSPECRDRQISMDEKKAKRQSRSGKKVEYSVSPCSDSIKFSAEVAAA